MRETSLLEIVQVITELNGKLGELRETGEAVLRVAQQWFTRCFCNDQGDWAVRSEVFHAESGVSFAILCRFKNLRLVGDDKQTITWRAGEVSALRTSAHSTITCCTLPVCDMSCYSYPLSISCSSSSNLLSILLLLPSSFLFLIHSPPFAISLLIKSCSL